MGLSASDFFGRSKLAQLTQTSEDKRWSEYFKGQDSQWADAHRLASKDLATNKAMLGFHAICAGAVLALGSAGFDASNLDLATYLRGAYTLLGLGVISLGARHQLQKIAEIKGEQQQIRKEEERRTSKPTMKQQKMIIREAARQKSQLNPG